ncbi:nuclease-related domain-containing protein [Paenibacillus ihuae]|uniref:nuclease-related domain-containing protein n=1 Tax=Paenibacillus ihuae TaxID=1232431 RepID=UPI0006D5A84D|nr:nuclease-related domain-containing protein [Paenibacillus ihuae]
MAVIKEKDNSLVLKYEQATVELRKKKLIPYILSFGGVILFITSIFLHSSTKLNMIFFGLGAIGIFWVNLINYLNPQLVQNSSDMLASGIRGETSTLELLSYLPDEYSIIPDLKIITKSGESQIDFIVIGKSGIWIIENKNMKGYISGELKDRNWLKEKVSSGGNTYTDSFQSPVKQVGTHVFRLKEFLQEKGIKRIPWIQGVVYFSDPQTQLNLGFTHADFPVFSDANSLLEYIQGHSQRSSEFNTAQIVEAVWNISNT